MGYLDSSFLIIFFILKKNLVQGEKIKKIYPPSNPKGGPFEPADSLRNRLLIQKSDKAVHTPEFKLKTVHQIYAWPDGCFPSS